MSNTDGIKARLRNVAVQSQALYRETCSTEPRPGKTGRPPKLDEGGLKRVDELIQSKPDITINEIRAQLGIDLSESRLSRIVREQLGYTFKKKWCMPPSVTGLTSNTNEPCGWSKCQPST